MKRSRWRNSQLGIFYTQIENNMLENHADQKKWFSSFNCFSLRCCNEQGDHKWFFFSVWLLDEAKEDDKLRHYSMYLPLFLCRNVSLGVSTRVGSSEASELVWKPAQFKCFEHVMWWKELSGYKGNIPWFYLLLLLLSSSFDTPHTHATKATKDLHFGVFK